MVNSSLSTGGSKSSTCGPSTLSPSICEFQAITTLISHVSSSLPWLTFRLD